MRRWEAVTCKALALNNLRDSEPVEANSHMGGCQIYFLYFEKCTIGLTSMNESQLETLERRCAKDGGHKLWNMATSGTLHSPISLPVRYYR